MKVILLMFFLLTINVVTVCNKMDHIYEALYKLDVDEVMRFVTQERVLSAKKKELLLKVLHEAIELHKSDKISYNYDKYKLFGCYFGITSGLLATIASAYGTSRLLKNKDSDYDIITGTIIYALIASIGISTTAISLTDIIHNIKYGKCSLKNFADARQIEELIDQTPIGTH